MFRRGDHKPSFEALEHSPGLLALALQNGGDLLSALPPVRGRSGEYGWSHERHKANDGD